MTDNPFFAEWREPFGLPAFVLQKILQPLYFAREDTRTPFRFAVNSMIVNAVVAVGMMPLIGFLAAALGTTVAAWVMVGQLWWGTRRMGLAAHLDDRLRSRVVRVALSSALMAAFLWVLRRWLAQDGEGDIPDLAILVFGGAAAYFALSFLPGAISPAELRANVRRRR